MTTTIPGLGPVNADGDWLQTEPRPTPILGQDCSFLIDGYEPQHAASLVTSIETFCALDQSTLDEVSEPVFDYYTDMAAEFDDEPDFPEIVDAEDVWDHVELTSEPLLRHDGAAWYVVLENECDWEPEHGLMIVLRDGHKVVKVGPYDDHLTNRQAFGDDSIPDDAIYWR